MSSVVSNVANRNAIGRQLAWNFIRTNWNIIMQRYGTSLFTLGRLILSVTSGFSSEFELSELIDFAKNNPDAGTGQHALTQATERVKANVDWVKENEKDVQNWLEDFIKENNIP